MRIGRCLESQVDLEMLPYDMDLMQVAGVLSEHHVEKLNSIVGSMQVVTDYSMVTRYLPPRWMLLSSPHVWLAGSPEFDISLFLTRIRSHCYRPFVMLISVRGHCARLPFAITVHVLRCRHEECGSLIFYSTHLYACATITSCHLDFSLISWAGTSDLQTVTLRPANRRAPASSVASSSGPRGMH